MASRELNQNFWNPIVNMNVTEKNRADRTSVKVRYASSEKLLTEVFEKKEEVVWIAKKDLR